MSSRWRTGRALVDWHIEKYAGVKAVSAFRSEASIGRWTHEIITPAALPLLLLCILFVLALWSDRQCLVLVVGCSLVGLRVFSKVDVM